MVVNEFPGLDKFIQHSIDKPALDSYLIDFQNQDIKDLPLFLERILTNFDDKMFYMGISDYNRIILTNNNKILSSYANEKVVVDEFCPDHTIFILTLSIDDRAIIRPPYSDYFESMGWHEFFSRLQNGEETHLINECPFLQGKIYNIGLFND